MLKLIPIPQIVTRWATISLACACLVLGVWPQWATQLQAQTGYRYISPAFIIDSGVTPANSDTGSPGKPGIGFDGVNYLMVSCRENGSAANIQGTLVSTIGSIVTAFPIADLNPVYGCSLQRPFVAFDGSNYLVVFKQVTETGRTDIVGARITPASAVLDGSGGFTILQDVVGAAVVAFDGSNYLVVSDRYSDATLHDIIGARVNSDGHVLDEFPIFTAPGGQVLPSIAFDGNNYLVIWSDTRSGSPIGTDANIYGTRVSPLGLVLDPGGIPISTAPGSQGFNDVIFDGENYFAVWDDTRNGLGGFDLKMDIYGTRITPSGVLLDGSPDTGGIAISTHPRPQERPVVSFTGTEYFVTWGMSYFLDPPEGIFAARVSTEGVLLDGPPGVGGILISNPKNNDSKFVSPNSHFNGSNVLLSWINNRELGGTFKDLIGVLVSDTSHTPYDLNGDSYADILWRNTSDGNIAIWFMNGMATASFSFPGAVPLAWKIAGVGDVNADGKGDVIWHNQTSGPVAIWLMNGGTVTAVGFPGTAPTTWSIQAVGDINGDGKADLIWRNTSEGHTAIWFMNGTAMASSRFPGGVPMAWQIAQVGDVDGDGKAEVIWRHSTSGAVAIWLMNDGTVTGVGFPGAAPTAWRIQAVGDVDGDRRADLLWRNTRDGNTAIWFMNGTAVAAAAFRDGVPLVWQIEQAADVNGDSKADIIWRNAIRGTVAIWLMDGLTVTAVGFPGSVSTGWKIQP